MAIMFRATVSFLFLYNLPDLYVTEITNKTLREESSTKSPEALYFKRLKNDWTVFCKLQPNGYDCTKTGFAGEPRFYYDIKMEDCRTAPFGTCSHNYNQFNSLTHCHEVCREPGLKALDVKKNLSEIVFCRLQYDFGYCNEYHPMWYFDMTQRTCRGFSYSGCGGNMNRFATAQLCTAVCGATLV